MELFERVREVIVEKLGVPPTKVTPKTSIYGDLWEVESLDFVELAMALEKEFGVEISEADFAKLEKGGTVNDLVELIGSQLTASVA